MSRYFAMWVIAERQADARSHGTISREKIMNATTNVTVIKPKALAALLDEGSKFDLVDVRTPVEYREVHVAIAQNVPLDQLDPQALMQSRNSSTNEPLYMICRSGSRGQKAC